MSRAWTFVRSNPVRAARIILATPVIAIGYAVLVLGVLVGHGGADAQRFVKENPL